MVEILGPCHHDLAAELPAPPSWWTRAISESGYRALTSTLGAPESTRSTMVAELPGVAAHEQPHAPEAAAGSSRAGVAVLTTTPPPATSGQVGELRLRGMTRLSSTSTGSEMASVTAVEV